jgi:tRNA threonylcarbamoyladenosine biosynthesis protein TsaB
MRQVYFAAYRRGAAGWECVHEPRVCAPEDVPLLPAGAWTGCGNGFAACGEALRARLGAQLATVAPITVPHAREIAALAAAALARGEAKPAAAALPIYVRDKVALTIEEQR